ncbi:MAG TPA: C40 family peptidase [Gelidibacter sp.]|uniref:C40 family peptidase n=1 Tax=Gelidibacter sp. TaxID=2018083 RepID=UPI002C8293AF|nr:C40 family peptidase [Gelidibacter sp.]HXJ98432.1 C40 family peptidase [Gelidibacter sp.]
MKKIALLLLLTITFSSCKSSMETMTSTSKTASRLGSKKSTDKFANNKIESLNSELTAVSLTPTHLNIISETPKIINTAADRIVDYAFAFDGVKYKRGGTTKDGMDCSGLVVTTFDSENIALPRVSRDIARTGSSIDLKQVTKGDLLFFATRKNSRTISHVGIVTTVRDGFVEFIHASTTNGVIVSSMTEKYWHSAFIQARRII